jgi:SAM-dependent methyltransferase
MTKNMADAEVEICLAGEKLYGDDFSQEEIDAWFADEADGYFNLTQSGEGGYGYGYHALNNRHGYAHLPNGRFGHVLGVGSAYGDELRPILTRSDKISILEPSGGFHNTLLDGVPVHYVKPVASGVIPFDAGSLDLITCLGVLHHIPNVSKVVQEFYRVLQPGGFALLREPTISMGDWRKPRSGLTKRELGIPLPVFRGILARTGFEVMHEKACMFSLTSRLKHLVPGAVFNSSGAVAFDALLCALPIWPRVYHARNSLEKLRPTAVYSTLRKPL